MMPNAYIKVLVPSIPYLNYHVFTISLGMVASAHGSHSGAVAMHLQVHGLGQSWEDGEHALGLQWGWPPARFCAQCGKKSTALSSLSFFFVGSKDSPRDT